ncbi:hypothetical protein [Nocardia sp. NPDC005998]|uniref:hypothetical protein n=1 Tax=Nocardia sp. NPDC005998 TaxID=3156894 RepID=UPI0033A935A7
MFDRRQWSVWRPFSPPRPVYVDIDRVLSSDGVPSARDVSATVRKYGLVLSGQMPATQRAWHRLVDGRWIASIEVPVETGGQWIFLDLIAPADAVSPRDDPVAFPERPSNQWGQPKRY